MGPIYVLVVLQMLAGTDSHSISYLRNPIINISVIHSIVSPQCAVAIRSIASAQIDMKNRSLGIVQPILFPKFLKKLESFFYFSPPKKGPVGSQY